MTTTPALSPLNAQSYTDAVETLREAAAAYYGGESPLDDDTYDRMARQVTAYEAEHPEHKAASSPTGKVAAGAVGGDVPHTAPMMSLDNVFSAEQLAAWAAGLERRLGRPVTACCVDAKLDGLAVAARYRDGALVQLLTRGDGTSGEDVSYALGTIAGLPVRLDLQSQFCKYHL